MFLFRGLIKAGLCKTFLHVKIRQKVKVPNPDLLGKNLKEYKSITLCRNLNVSIGKVANLRPTTMRQIE